MQSLDKDPQGNGNSGSRYSFIRVGVTTNIEGIGLEKAGIKTEKSKVVVDDFYQTSVPGIFAIGDIVHGPALAHVASAEGIICVEKLQTWMFIRWIMEIFRLAPILTRK